MIVPLAVVARRVAVVRVLGAVRAALVAHHQVGGEVDVRGRAAGAEDHVGPLQRRVRVRGPVGVHARTAARRGLRATPCRPR